MLCFAMAPRGIFSTDPAELARAVASHINAASPSLDDTSFLQVREPLSTQSANWTWARRMDTGEDAAENIVGRRRQGRLPAGHEIDRAVCRTKIAVDLKGAMRHEIGSTHTTNALVQEFTEATASGIAGFFVKYATVTLPNIFMDALIDVLCDIMCYGLIFAVAYAVGDNDSTTMIAKGIAQEVEFALPPAFTVVMTASVSIYLSHMMVGYLARTSTQHRN